MPTSTSPPRPPRGPAHSNSQQVVLRALRRTHRQLETGQYAQAYPTLKRLADGTDPRRKPIQAAMLYAQAARARIEMAPPGTHNAAWNAVELGLRALHLLSSAERAARAQTLLAQMLKLLERKHYYEQAVELRAQGTALLGAKSKAIVSLPEAVLPVKCPSCYAPLRADEVEWIEAQSAECVYCGSPVRVE